MAVAAAGEVLGDLAGQDLDRVRVSHRVVVDGQAATDLVSRQTQPARLQTADRDVPADDAVFDVADDRGFEGGEDAGLGRLAAETAAATGLLETAANRVLWIRTPSGEFATMLPETTTWLVNFGTFAWSSMQGDPVPSGLALQPRIATAPAPTTTLPVTVSFE